MCNIDYIMSLIDWHKSSEDQKKGIELAKMVKSINVFIQPIDRINNKNVWDNCAKILSARNDEELEPYLIQLMEWLQDLTWPGAICILNRMRNYTNRSSFDFAFRVCIRRAKALDDVVWLNNLNEIFGYTIVETLDEN